MHKAEQLLHFITKLGKDFIPTYKPDGYSFYRLNAEILYILLRTKGFSFTTHGSLESFRILSAAPGKTRLVPSSPLQLQVEVQSVWGIERADNNEQGGKSSGVDKSLRRWISGKQILFFRAV